MVCSSFFVVVLSKRDFFLGSPFVSDSFQFFVSYLLSTPTWGMSVRTALVAKFGCIFVFLFGLGLLFEDFLQQHQLGVPVVPVIDSSSFVPKCPSEPVFVI